LRVIKNLKNMKSFYTTIIFTICCITASYSQIPNGGFEDWVTVGTYEEPVSWRSMNSASSILGVVTCEKGTPGNPGNYYLKLTSKNVMGLGVIQGIVISGSQNPDNEEETFTGFAFTQRPANFTGKWQHMIYGTSQGVIAVQLTKWDEASQSRTYIASLEYVLTGMAMSWANFSLPLTYHSSDYPDTCTIFLTSSGETPTVNDFLYVDNLSFSGSVSGIKDNAINAIQMYPNPAKDQITIEHNLPINNESTIMIVNLLGELLYTEPLTSNKQTINIDVLKNGIYFVTIKSKEGILTQKLVVNR